MKNGFFTGINYWASKNAIQMWRDYDRTAIKKDMEVLKNAGITVLRVFPNWEDFQPLTAFTVPGGSVYEYGLKGKPLPNTPAGRAGVDEEMCVRFEDFCAIAKEFGMKLIVGLLTGHMSFGNLVPPALVNLDLMTDTKALRWEMRYVTYLVTRFSRIKNIIAWDLGNEVNNLKGNATTKDDFYVWSTMIANTIKASDNTRPVMSGVGGFEIEQGFPNLLDMKDGCDVNTVHGYNIFDTPQDPVNSAKPILDYIFKCRLSEDIGKMPTFIQEFGAIGYTNCSMQTEREFYRGVTLSALAHGFHGVMYWCAFDQGHFTFPPYNWNNIGSDYGFFDKDLKMKPVAKENLRLKALIEEVGKTLPSYQTNCVILAPREEYESPKNTLRASYILAKRAGLEPTFVYATKEIPRADCYIFPSVKFDKAITNTSLLVLLENVAQGATLYISLSNALFRRIAELAGVCIHNRVDRKTPLVVSLGNDILPVTANVSYDFTVDVGEVLAKQEDGTPVFLKNKYGKGNIYVLFAPLEEYCANKEGAFFEEDAPKYEEIYKCFSKEITAKKISQCNNRFINITEHYHANGTVSLFAINYSNRKQTAHIQLPEGYHCSVVWGKEWDNGQITLDACDGILLKATKR